MKGKEGPRFIVVVVATRSVPQGRKAQGTIFFIFYYYYSIAGR